MEQTACNPVSLRSLLCAPIPVSKHYSTNNPVVCGSLRIWSQFRLHFNSKQALPSAPILLNPLFPPSLIDSAFQLWSRNGISCVKDLFKDGVFISFQQLRTDFEIPQSNFFRYLQVRSFIKKHFSPSLNQPEGGWIDELLNMDPFRRGMVSILYEVIQRTASPSLDHIRRQWEEELGIEISDSAWQCTVERLGYVCNPRSLKEGMETSRRVTDELGSRLERPIHFECN